jgi:hypothetical protein
MPPTPLTYKGILSSWSLNTPNKGNKHDHTILRFWCIVRTSAFQVEGSGHSEKIAPSLRRVEYEVTQNAHNVQQRIQTPDLHPISFVMSQKWE